MPLPHGLESVRFWLSDRPSMATCSSHPGDKRRESHAAVTLLQVLRHSVIAMRFIGSPAIGRRFRFPPNCSDPFCHFVGVDLGVTRQGHIGKPICGGPEKL